MAKAKNRLPQMVVDELVVNMTEDIKCMERVGERAEDTFVVKDGFLRTSNIWVAYNEGTKTQIDDAYDRALSAVCDRLDHNPMDYAQMCVAV